MEMTGKKKSVVTRINQIVKQLSEEEQNELLRDLEYKIMKEKARKISKGIKKNNLTMADIVEETRIVREARYKKNE